MKEWDIEVGALMNNAALNEEGDDGDRNTSSQESVYAANFRKNVRNLMLSYNKPSTDHLGSDLFEGAHKEKLEIHRRQKICVLLKVLLVPSQMP